MKSSFTFYIKNQETNLCNTWDSIAERKTKWAGVSFRYWQGLNNQFTSSHVTSIEFHRLMSEEQLIQLGEKVSTSLKEATNLLRTKTSVISPYEAKCLLKALLPSFEGREVLYPLTEMPWLLQEDTQFISNEVNV